MRDSGCGGRHWRETTRRDPFGTWSPCDCPSAARLLDRGEAHRVVARGHDVVVCPMVLGASQAQ
ncbi:hypothetical protein PA07A_1099 [Cutibacterium acnes P07A]|nr:hypothetical protein [Cutibacterium acnes P07A]